MNNWFPNLFNYGESQSPVAHETTHNLPTGTKEDLDRILAESVSRLSFQEREAALEEIHGISQNNSETPESIRNWLQLLDMHVKNAKGGTVYEIAEAMDRAYVSDVAFRLMFLRADRYDPQLAAKRLIEFFEVKRTLFGVNKLVTDITFDELDEDAKECVERGSVQISSLHDNAGRPILICIPCLRSYRTIESELRARFYMAMNLMKSQQAQILGIVGIWYAVAPSVQKTERQFGSNTGLLYALPVYWASCHICSSSFVAYALAYSGVFFTPPKIRSRVRTSYGNHKEILETLATFGIPKDAIPLTREYEPSTTEHLKWLAERRRQEMEERNRKQMELSHQLFLLQHQVNANQLCKQQQFLQSEDHRIGGSTFNHGTLPPSSVDVVFGRGRKLQEHPGNVRLRSILAEKQSEYDNATRLGRTILGERIVQEIKAGGGRFLKNSDTGWAAVSDKEARTKVTMAFRSQRKLAKLATADPPGSPASEQEKTSRPSPSPTIHQQNGVAHTISPT